MAPARNKILEGNKRSSQSDTACPASENERVCSNLFRAISHDMRTPLASIIGNSLTLQENWELLSDLEKLAGVAKIYEDSDWLINMVENLLAVTRMRGDNAAIHTSEELVEEVIGEALQKLEKRHPGSTVHVTIPENYIFLPMDALLIEQVIINLLENALNRSCGRKPVELFVEECGEMLSFTVRDCGTAIPEDALEHPFEGTFCTAADAQRGWGIMIVTCKAILDAHQGALTIRNHRYGAEFVFTLPKAKEENI